MIAKEIGAQIARARKARKLAITDISEQTRISVEYLKKIESGDFDFLPKPYVIAYIKTFAARVDLDGKALVDEWQAEEARARARAEAEANEAEKAIKTVTGDESKAPAGRSAKARAKDASRHTDEKKHLKEFGVGASVIAALALVFYIASQPGGSSQGQNSGAEKATSEMTIDSMIAENEARIDSIVSDIPEMAPEAEEEAQPPFTLRLEASDTVWIKLVVDGADTSEYLFRPGNSQTWQAQNYFVLRTGNAGATHIFRNGVPLDSLGGHGRVRELRITRNEMR